MANKTLFGFTYKMYDNLFDASPYASGNLQDRGHQVKQLTPKSMMVVIGGKDAPYAPILYHGSKFSQKHKGWVYRVALATALQIAKETGGKTYI